MVKKRLKLLIPYISKSFLDDEYASSQEYPYFFNPAINLNLLS